MLPPTVQTFAALIGGRNHPYIAAVDTTDLTFALSDIVFDCAPHQQRGCFHLVGGQIEGRGRIQQWLYIGAVHSDSVR